MINKRFDALHREIENLAAINAKFKSERLNVKKKLLSNDQVYWVVVFSSVLLTIGSIVKLFSGQ